MQFLNCHQKNKTVLNSVTIFFFLKKKPNKQKKNKEEENPKQLENTLGLAMIPMTTYNDGDDLKDSVGGDDDFDCSVGGDNGFDDCY